MSFVNFLKGIGKMAFGYVGGFVFWFLGGLVAAQGNTELGVVAFAIGLLLMLFGIYTEKQM